MEYTELELSFINDHADELNSENKDDLNKVLLECYSAGLKRLTLFILYITNSLKNMEVSIDRNYSGANYKIEDCILNNTTHKANGVPITNSLFTAGTKVIFSQIKGGRVIKKENSSLSKFDRKTLRDYVSQNDFNLVCLDTQKANETLSKFDGQFDYLIYFWIHMTSVRYSFPKIKFTSYPGQEAIDRIEKEFELILDNLEIDGEIKTALLDMAKNNIGKQKDLLDG